MSIEDRNFINYLVDSDEHSELESTRQEIRRTLDQLRDDYRTVLILRFISGLTAEETGAVMGRTATAVRVLQHRALTALRNLLDI